MVLFPGFTQIPTQAGETEWVQNTIFYFTILGLNSPTVPAEIPFSGLNFKTAHRETFAPSAKTTAGQRKRVSSKTPRFRFGLVQATTGRSRTRVLNYAAIELRNQFRTRLARLAARRRAARTSERVNHTYLYLFSHKKVRRLTCRISSRNTYAVL